MLRNNKISYFALVFLINLLFTRVVLGDQITLPPLNSSASILIDVDTGVIIHQNNAHKYRYPASLTKLMTALLLLENINHLEERIAHSVEAVFSIPRGSSNIAMNDGETLSAREALYAIMLASANEVSNAIAEHIAGDKESFAIMMTERAYELGAFNTNFTNAHGLHDENHYTTAYDIALITLELLNHPTFVEIISTRSFNIPPTERQPLDRMLNNTHRMIQPGHIAFNSDVVGGKTGFTNQAMHTLSTYARRDGVGLIAVVMQNSAGHHYLDTQALFDFGFSLYTRVPVITSNSFDHSINVVQTSVSQGGGQSSYTVGQVNIEPGTNLFVNLPNTINIDDIEIVINSRSYLTAPFPDRTIVGTATAMYNNRQIGAVALVTETGFELIELYDQDAIAVYGSRINEPVALMSNEVPSITDTVVDYIIQFFNINATISVAISLFLILCLFGILRFIVRSIYFMTYKKKKKRRRYSTVQHRGSQSRGSQTRQPRYSSMTKYRYK